MKTKIENTNLWVDYKLERMLSKTLSYYNNQDLFAALTSSQSSKINKILELEQSFEKEYGARGSYGYFCIPKITDREP